MKNIFESGELEESSTVKKFLTVQKEGVRQVKREVIHYKYISKTFLQKTFSLLLISLILANNSSK